MDKTLQPLRENVVIATIFGFERDPNGGPALLGRNSRPEHIRQVAGESRNLLRATGFSGYARPISRIGLKARMDGRSGRCGL